MDEDGPTTLLVGSTKMETAFGCIWKQSHQEAQQGINGKASLSKVGNPHVLHDQGQGSMKLL